MCFVVYTRSHGPCVIARFQFLHRVVQYMVSCWVVVVMFGGIRFFAAFVRKYSMASQ